MSEIPTQARDLIRFWQEAGRERWFTHDAAFDEECRMRFGALHQKAAAGELAGWDETADGALALVLLLDQIPRNIFRQDARTWATDPLALRIAERAVSRGFHEKIASDLQACFFLPFMHSEDLAAQDRSVALYRDMGDPDGLHWAQHHRDIVARFGRFPHRNAVLGRETTPEEEQFLAEDSFRG